MDERIVEMLKSGSKSDKLRALSEAAGSLEKGVIKEVAECYFSEDEEIRERAFEALRQTAQKFADSLQTFFEFVPWDSTIVWDEKEFEVAYSVVERETRSFADVEERTIERILTAHPETLLIFRMIVGLTLDELSFILQEMGFLISKDELREVERKGTPLRGKLAEKWGKAVRGVASVIFRGVEEGLLNVPEGVDISAFKRRTEKIDTREGWESVRKAALKGVRYVDLLYQRYIGGIFRQVADASSSLKAEILEGPIETLLTKEGIPFYRTRPRERIKGWEPVPNFFIPSKEEPLIVIEAKVAKDGGTARDKASRIEKLARVAQKHKAILIAVIDGKGFKRLNDVLVPILAHTRGLTFSSAMLPQMVEFIKSIVKPFVEK